MHIEGGCHCGYITYEAEVDPDAVGICHCTDCQTLTGTAFRTTVPAPKAGFKILTGQPKIYVKTAESGNKRAHAFCPGVRDARIRYSRRERSAVLRHTSRDYKAKNRIAAQETGLVPIRTGLGDESGIPAAKSQAVRSINSAPLQPPLPYGRVRISSRWPLGSLK